MTAPEPMGFRPLGRWRSGAPYQMCCDRAETFWNRLSNASLNSPQRDVEYRWAGVLNRFLLGVVPYLRWPFAATA